jgi:hypothetical protein
LISLQNLPYLLRKTLDLLAKTLDLFTKTLDLFTGTPGCLKTGPGRRPGEISLKYPQGREKVVY